MRVYRVGRELVIQELDRQGKSLCAMNFKQNEDDFDELNTLIDVTDSRVINDVSARIVAAAARFTLLGLTGKALEAAVRQEVESGSTAYIDRTATGLANRTLNIGRSDEAAEHSEIERVEYSALLDQNVCGPCAADDGETTTNEDDLTPAPNPDCEGGDWCRCFHVFLTT